MDRIDVGNYPRALPDFDHLAIKVLLRLRQGRLIVGAL
jgi:hypothetical protein